MGKGAKGGGAGAVTRTKGDAGPAMTAFRAAVAPHLAAIDDAARQLLQGPPEPGGPDLQEVRLDIVVSAGDAATRDDAPVSHVCHEVFEVCGQNADGTPILCSLKICIITLPAF